MTDRTEEGADPGQRAPDSDDIADSGDDIADDSQMLSLAKHFYRGEMDRVTTWRNRMDQTTNWAVVVMAAILTWSFTSPDNPHYVLLIGVLAVIVFLFIEAQRYQQYDGYRTRVRVLQRNLFSETFDHEGPEQDEWREWLSESLREPSFQLSLLEAIGHRLQHVYFPLLTVLLTAWVFRITVFESGPWQETVAIESIPGPVVVGVVGLLYAVTAGLTFWSIRQSYRREFSDVGGSE